MKRFMMAIPCLALLSGLAFAQSSSQPRGWGYLFVAPGGTSGSGATTTLQAGAGGEGLFYKGLGAGAELGHLTPTGSFAVGFGIFSANASYHFGGKGKLVPFITGGYSLAFRGGTNSGGNFGGGIHYWFNHHAALRAEFRDHVFSNGFPHFYGFRIGVALH